MSDYGDLDDFDPDDYNYFYVEDEYPLAVSSLHPESVLCLTNGFIFKQDDLAEHVVASPIPNDADSDWDDTSRFTSYWDDLDYNGDGYDDYDVRGKSKPSATFRSKLGKRKSKGVKKDSRAKRQRLSSPSPQDSIHHTNSPILLWMTFKERSTVDNKKVTDTFDHAVSLLPDWRERYKDKLGFPNVAAATSLEEVVDGEDADATDELYDGLDYVPPPRTNRNGKRPLPADMDEGAVMREEDSDDGKEEEMGIPEIDPDALKMALKQRLAAAGLKVNGLDEQALLQFAQRMLAVGDSGDADDIVGELADDLLDRDEEDEEEEGLVNWVSKQVETAQNGKPDDVNTNSENSDASTPVPLPQPQLDASPDRPKSKLVTEPWPQPALMQSMVSPGKRKAERIDDGFEAAAPPPKRRAPSYAAPTNSSKAKNKATVNTNKNRPGSGKA